MLKFSFEGLLSPSRFSCIRVYNFKKQLVGVFTGNKAILILAFCQSFVCSMRAAIFAQIIASAWLFLSFVVSKCGLINLGKILVELLYLEARGLESVYRKNRVYEMLIVQMEPGRTLLG